MGVVYFGRSAGGRPVAIKVIRSEAASDEQFRRRFHREIRAARRVGGFHTAQIIDADSEAEQPWMATAYIPGLSLAEIVSRTGPLPPPTVRRLAAGLAEGLEAVHRADLVHRDLKPANVVLTDDGPRVIDFGIAKMTGADTATLTAGVIGSPAYMSPEQVTGQDVSAASDIFSFGSVLVYALTGASPFGEGTMHVLMYRVISAEPDLTAVPGEMRDLIGRCLAKDFERRPDLTEILSFFASAEAISPGWLGPEATRLVARCHDPEIPSAAPDTAARTRSEEPQGGEPDAEREMLERARRHAENGEVGEARFWYVKLSATGASLGCAAAFGLGRLEEGQGNSSGATDAYLKAVSFPERPEAVLAMDRLAAMALARKNVPAAREWLIRLVASGHSDLAPKNMRRLGAIESDLGDVAAARTWLSRAAACEHPDEAPLALNDLGDLERVHGKAGVARDWYARAIASDHPDAVALAQRNLGDLEADQGNPRTARDWWNRAASSGHPDQAPRAMNRLGLLEQEQGDTRAATE